VAGSVVSLRSVGRAGVSVELVVDQYQAPLSFAAVITDFHAMVTLPASAGDGIKAGTLWSLVVNFTDPELAVVAMNGAIARSDG
jgi:hypothetical protein